MRHLNDIIPFGSDVFLMGIGIASTLGSTQNIVRDKLINIDRKGGVSDSIALFLFGLFNACAPASPWVSGINPIPKLTSAHLLGSGVFNKTQLKFAQSPSGLSNNRFANNILNKIDNDALLTSFREIATTYSLAEIAHLLMGYSRPKNDDVGLIVAEKIEGFKQKIDSDNHIDLLLQNISFCSLYGQYNGFFSNQRNNQYYADCSAIFAEPTELLIWAYQQGHDDYTAHYSKHIFMLRPDGIITKSRDLCASHVAAFFAGAMAKMRGDFQKVCLKTALSDIDGDALMLQATTYSCDVKNTPKGRTTVRNNPAYDFCHGFGTKYPENSPLGQLYLNLTKSEA